MYEIKIKPEKNRLYLTLFLMRSEEGPDFLSEIEQAVGQLKGDFSVVSDITQFSVNDPEANVWADKIIAFLAEKGMKRAVRVIGRNSGEKAAESYGYLISTAKSIDEADAFLDKAK